MENFSRHSATPILPGYNVVASSTTYSASSLTNNDPNLGVQVKNKAKNFDRQALGILSETPKFPQYSTLDSRLQTYETWPSDVEQTPEVLAAAGLFYTGCDKMVRCYFCGGGLKSWDPLDNPWEEHERWYPSCPHIKLNKESVRSNPTNTPRCMRSPCDSNTYSLEKQAEHEDDGLQSVAAQSLLINGVEERKVKRAVKHLRRRKGDVEMKAEDLLMIVFDLEDGDCNDDSEKATLERETFGQSDQVGPHRNESRPSSANQSAVATKGDLPGTGNSNFDAKDLMNVIEDMKEEKRSQSSFVSRESSTESGLEAVIENTILTGTQGAQIGAASRIQVQQSQSSPCIQESDDVLLEANRRPEEQHLCMIYLDEAACIVYRPSGHVEFFPRNPVRKYKPVLKLVLKYKTPEE